MEKYIKYINEFQEGNEFGLYFIKNKIGDGSIEISKGTYRQLTKTEIEHILDFLYHKKKFYKNIGLKTIYEKSEKWVKDLQKISIKDEEEEGKDYEIIKDYGDGYKIVKLLSKESYEREGKLMSHCVSSYFGRNTEIYSLRDDKNLPHCTIEKNNQIKGKGNGKIDTKYIDYIVQFLEYIGMKVGENEMKNLGYYKLDYIDNNLFCEKNYNGYIYEGDFEKIIDKNKEQYYGFGLFKIKKILEIKLDFSVKWNFDFKKIIEYFNKNVECNSTAVANGYSCTAVSNGCNSTAVSNGCNSTAVANMYNSTAVANRDNSISVANDCRSTAVANMYNSTAVANMYNSTAVANSDNSTAVANMYNSTAVANRDNSISVANDCRSTAVANMYNSTAVANSDNSTAVANGYNSVAVANDCRSTAVANDCRSTAVANGYNSVALCRGYNSIVCGKKGSWLILAQYDKNNEKIIDIKYKLVDGKIIKENTKYILVDGEFSEYFDKK